MGLRDAVSRLTLNDVDNSWSHVDGTIGCCHHPEEGAPCRAQTDIGDGEGEVVVGEEQQVVVDAIAPTEATPTGVTPTGATPTLAPIPVVTVEIELNVAPVKELGTLVWAEGLEEPANSVSSWEGPGELLREVYGDGPALHCAQLLFRADGEQFFPYRGWD